jgi:hypothetical protein
MLRILAIILSTSFATHANEANNTIAASTNHKSIAIPHLNQAIQIPESWVVADRKMLEASYSKVEFEDENSKESALKGLDLLNNSGLTIMQHPEPYDGWNASVNIIWYDFPPEYAEIPQEVKKEILLASLTEMVKAKSKRQDFQILQAPKPLSNHDIATATIKSKLKFNDGKIGSFINQLFGILNKERVIFVVSSYEETQGEDVKQELKKILASFPPLSVGLDKE